MYKFELINSKNIMENTISILQFQQNIKELKNLYNVKISDTDDFRECIISPSRIKKNILIKDCDFTINEIQFTLNKELNYENIEIDFINCRFKNLIFCNFDNCKIRFIENKYSKLEYNDTHNKSLEFSCSKNSKIDIKNIKIEQISVIEHSENSIINIENLTNTKISIQESSLNKVSIKNITNGDITIYNNSINVFDYYKSTKDSANNLYLELNDFNKIFKLQDLNLNEFVLKTNIFQCSLLLENLNIAKSTFSNNVIEKNIIFKNIKILNSNTSEIFRVLKQFAHKNQDQKQYLNFYKLEQNKLLTEKDTSYIDRKIIQIKELASKHGTDPFRALSFIVLSSITIFSIIFISDNYMHKLAICKADTFLNEYLKYIFPTNMTYKSVFGEDAIENSFRTFAFYFGKIIIAFGIYEMIISFRKFHR